jgi:hypothetical protein
MTDLERIAKELFELPGGRPNQHWACLRATRLLQAHIETSTIRIERLETVSCPLLLRGTGWHESKRPRRHAVLLRVLIHFVQRVQGGLLVIGGEIGVLGVETFSGPF